MKDGFLVEKVGAAVVGVEVVGLMVGLAGEAVTVGGFNTNVDESPTTPKLEADIAEMVTTPDDGSWSFASNVLESIPM